MPARPVIALLTDFGTADPYAGTMKGVLANICPDAVVIDITHEVAPQDIRGAAWRLAAAWRYFPRDTIFLVVVDPGVGTARPAVVIHVDGAWLVGPDNGVFDLVLTASPALEAWRLTQTEWMRPAVSATFEGRDRFAPAAAWLARGTPASALGEPMPVAPRLDWRQPVDEPHAVVGEVVYVDRFGNLITNLTRARCAGRTGDATIGLADYPAAVPLVRTYAEAPTGDLVALFGSSDCLEIAVVGGSAAARLGVDRGATVRLAWPT